MKIRNLFQKAICSLITIIYVSKDKTRSIKIFERFNFPV